MSGPTAISSVIFRPAGPNGTICIATRMRGFWRGNPGILGNFAERFAGSSDLFRASGRRPTASINYVACHDGFTLYDATAYDEKHNEANLEDNRDGHNHNLSWNCGVEGPTDDPAVIELRERQIRNLLATLLLSQGVPMLLAGDEFGRTQRGNNNAYCQDNEISWIDWDLAARRSWLTAFVRQLLTLRRQAPGLRRDTFLKGARQVDREHKDVSWRHPLGHELTAADWHDGNARAHRRADRSRVHRSAWNTERTSAVSVQCQRSARRFPLAGADDRRGLADRVRHGALARERPRQPPRRRRELRRRVRTPACCSRTAMRR